MSRLCRLRTKTHGADGQWAYEEITKLREQVEYHKAYAEEAMSEFNWLMETKKAQAAVIEKFKRAIGAWDKAETPSELQSAEAGLLKALAIPTDSTRILDEVRRAERDKCAKVCEHMYADVGKHLAWMIRAME